MNKFWTQLADKMAEVCAKLTSKSNLYSSLAVVDLLYRMLYNRCTVQQIQNIILNMSSG